MAVSALRQAITRLSLCDHVISRLLPAAVSHFHTSTLLAANPKPKRRVVNYNGRWKGIDWANLDKEEWEKLDFGIDRESSVPVKMMFLRKWGLLKAGVNVEELEYTTEALPMQKHGGRGPDGKIWVKRIGGGAKQRFRWVDTKRIGPEDGSTLEEKVCYVRYDPLRSADIALVAGPERRRWLIATDNMQQGDVIRTSSHIPRMNVRPRAGDAWPLGALPLGTFVCCVEKLSGEGAAIATAAGTQCQLVHKVGGRAILRMPSKREMNVSEVCTAVVGRVSNPDHNKEQIGSANRARWFGVRPKSGLWHRKTGHFGRKIKPIKPTLIVSRPPPPPRDSFKLGPE